MRSIVPDVPRRERKICVSGSAHDLYSWRFISPRRFSFRPPAQRRVGREFQGFRPLEPAAARPNRGISCLTIALVLPSEANTYQIPCGGPRGAGPGFYGSRPAWPLRRVCVYAMAVINHGNRLPCCRPTSGLACPACVGTQFKRYPIGRRPTSFPLKPPIGDDGLTQTPRFRPIRERLEWQGQRSLTLCAGKDLCHEVEIPAAASALHGDAFSASMLLKQR